MSSAKPPAPPIEKPERRDPPLRRWLNVACRSLHVVGIILLGAALLAGTSTTPGALLTAASGLGMLALDTWRKPAHLAEVSGSCPSSRWRPSSRRHRSDCSGRLLSFPWCSRTHRRPSGTGASSCAADTGRATAHAPAAGFPILPVVLPVFVRRFSSPATSPRRAAR